MNVAFCTGCGHGHDGIADYARHLAAGLRAEGVDVRVLPLEFYRGDKAFYCRLADQVLVAAVGGQAAVVLCPTPP